MLLKVVLPVLSFDFLLRFEEREKDDEDLRVSSVDAVTCLCDVTDRSIASLH